jgi:RHS repeat-associated protein
MTATGTSPRLERIVAANTAEMQVLYDALTGRPDRIAHTLGAATLAGFDYGFDTDGKILSIADAGGTREFTYDATLQLTGGGYAGAEFYSYDAEGNRETSHLSPSYTHDAANRLRSDEDTCYDYDANGNLTTRREKVGLDCTDISGAATTYEWDVLNRLVRIDFADGTWATYRYDAQGRRIEKDVNGALTRYVYDGDAILLEYDGADVLQARYSHGEEIDQPLAMARDTDADGQLGAAERFFYHTDHLGSVRLVTDAAGAVANRYDYDSFGNIEQATRIETVVNPFGFTARERDAESGLMFYRARYYDPQLGRFISEDPIGFEGEDLNLYRYVGNLPTIFADPSGQSFIEWDTLVVIRIHWIYGVEVGSAVGGALHFLFPLSGCTSAFLGGIAGVANLYAYLAFLAAGGGGIIGGVGVLIVAALLYVGNDLCEWGLLEDLV